MAGYSLVVTQHEVVEGIKVTLYDSVTLCVEWVDFGDITMGNAACADPPWTGPHRNRGVAGMPLS